MSLEIEEEVYPLDERVMRGYRTRPTGIHLSLSSTFGKAEVEKTARRLVVFFVEKGCWTSFTTEELTDFYKRNGWDPNTMFFGLMGLWYDDGMIGGVRDSWPCIMLDEAGRHYVTNHFVNRCAGEYKKNAA